VKKKKVGRPKLKKEVQQQRAVSLSTPYVKKLKKIGGGSISAGIRKLVDDYDNL